jgi:hypothetical protein
LPPIPSRKAWVSLLSASASRVCTSCRSCASILLACTHDRALCLRALASILVPSTAMCPR